MVEQIEAVKRELRGGELVPLKHTRDIVPHHRMPPATPEPEVEPEPPAAAGPRRIPVQRDGEQPSR
jgi:MerR family transcriptional regulator/heat shock protein HspR